MGTTITPGRSAQRRITILGSTGSIGESTLSVLEHAASLGEANFTVEAMTANRNVEKLAEQARKFNPKFVAVADASLGDDLRAALAGTGIETGAGEAAVEEAACRDADWVMAAIVGAAGLKPTLKAAQRGADIALANKECLVCAGEVVTAAIREAGGALLPVDSEHNAIFQVFDFNQPERVSRLILTASGGPFRTWTREAMAEATPAQAVAHPNWSMGAKISVDSATMMNKGLELIEASVLYALPDERLDVVIHPQSTVHSVVEYVDGSMLAQLGESDMRVPIAHALAWPQRWTSGVGGLDLGRLGSLQFEAPDLQRFPCLGLAREALRGGGVLPNVLNAANEIAVEAFLNGRLRFTGIATLIEKTLDRALSGAPPDGGDLASILAIDAWARARAGELLNA